MDAVILAAGKGERLNGIMPRFHKPLMVVNGMPLVRQATEAAFKSGAEQVVVVVAPGNTQPISEVLEGFSNLKMVVQRHATGPGDGLVIGLELVRTDRALVLMGDNVLTVEDVRAVVAAEPFAVGVQSLPATDDAQRFTRYTSDGSWLEKVPYKGEGEDIVAGHITAWVGPITIDVNAARDALACLHKAFHHDGVEHPIGPYLNYISPNAKLVNVNSIDIGTPQAIIMEGTPGK